MTIDRFLESSHLNQSPILSSVNLNWQEIYLEYGKYSAGETPEHCDRSTDIFIYHFLSLQSLRWKVNGQSWQEKAMPPGQSSANAENAIAIVPANVLHKLSWKAEIETIKISLAPDLIARVAWESIAPANVEIEPTFARYDPLIAHLGRALKSLLETEAKQSRLYAESVATMLSAHLLQHYCSRKAPLLDFTGGMPPYKLRQAIAHINDSLDRDLSLSAIASEVGISQYHFARLFKQAMGISVHQYVIQRRVETAKQLLLRRQLSITEIALQVGFANPSHLSQHFKRIVGVTPTAFLNQ
jgi:AraC family transcriptional regulator